MGDTKIEWCDKVWNPVTGCTKVSQGCKNCYAERMFHRPYPGRDFADVRCHPERLDDPLHWRKPQKIFVNSMSDLFHEKVPGEFIVKVFRAMNECNLLRASKGLGLHTFMVLTKRPQRMLDILGNHPGWRDIHSKYPNDPLRRAIRLGVSVEDQETADERIPLLLETPAAVRWVSIEPMLGPVKLRAPAHDPVNEHWICGHPGCSWPTLDWVVVGGESGSRARPMHPDWARSMRDQCRAAGVPFFFKQGSQANWPIFYKDFASFPEDLQIREFPCLPSITG